MPVLKVKGLCKDYPTFHLREVSFELERGRIMGFIGRNGAGKTTTLKCLLNLAHPSSGHISFFGMDFDGNEAEIKRRIGFASGGVDYYTHRKLSEIAAVTKTFYTNWDDDAFEKYLSAFELDKNKRLLELSEGMKVKFNLALALSHHAEFLLLDEPTSGLDPFSRDELLDIFRGLAQDGIAILFSTHIISDLEKCADNITYIHRGEIMASQTKESFIAQNARPKENGSVETLEEIMLRLEREAVK